MQCREGGLPPEYTVYEFPLRKWVDVPGSKVKTVDFPRGLYELARIRFRYLRRRRVERRREYTNA